LVIDRKEFRQRSGFCFVGLVFFEFLQEGGLQQVYSHIAFLRIRAGY
jgi:hypothetical protein